MGGEVHASKLETLIGHAVSTISESKTLRHQHSRKCYRVLRPILYPDEYTVLEVKQSRIKSFAPTRIICTNQRLIIAKPSFWCLHLGINIFSSTKYETIPYNHIISITLNNGMLLSSINMRLDVGTITEGEEVQGIRGEAAKTLFVFLEKLNEYLQEYSKVKEERSESLATPVIDKMLNFINMERARRIVKQKGTKFVWLGLEPLEYAAEILCIDKESVIKFNIDVKDKVNADALKQLKDHVLVSYNDVLAVHVSKFMKQSCDVDSYILKGGIEAQIQEALN